MSTRVRNEEFIKRFGKRLKQAREARGLSQEQLANICDIEHSQVSRIERGVVNATISTIVLLADNLGLEPWELIKLD